MKYMPIRAASFAGFVSRAIAFVIDLVITMAAVAIVIGFVQAIVNYFDLFNLLSPDWTSSGTGRTIVVGVTTLISIAITIGYPVSFWVLFGQTIGKMLVGVRIVRTDEKPMTVRRALLRFFGYWVSMLPFFLGFLWVLVDDRRQAWHDKLAGTFVLYANEPQVSKAAPQ